ncbi:hypothetical protein HK102_005318 [Quaeritorhiza haematococci]|nr:hypothetical protein HK102_005318 [Quaeritorhiza haematococci]
MSISASHRLAALFVLPALLSGVAAQEVQPVPAGGSPAASTPGACFTIENSQEAPELNGLSILGFVPDYTDTASFDTYLRARRDDSPAYIESFRTSFDCPGWNGTQQRFHMSFFTSLLVFISRPEIGGRCPGQQQWAPLCPQSCTEARNALTSIFNNPAFCSQTPSPTGVSNRTTTLATYESYCNTLTGIAAGQFPQNPNAGQVTPNVNPTCLQGLSSEVRTCGFVQFADATEFCRVNGAEQCCRNLPAAPPGAPEGTPANKEGANKEGANKEGANKEGANKEGGVVAEGANKEGANKEGVREGAIREGATVAPAAGNNAVLIIGVILGIVALAVVGAVFAVRRKKAKEGALLAARARALNAAGMQQYNQTLMRSEKAALASQYNTTSRAGAVSHIDAEGTGTAALAAVAKAEAAFQGGYKSATPSVNYGNAPPVTPLPALPTASGEDASERWKVVHVYVPTLTDEIELNYGDDVNVTERFDDGWAFGTNVTINQTGAFPLACVVRADDFERATSPSRLTFAPEAYRKSLGVRSVGASTTVNGTIGDLLFERDANGNTIRGSVTYATLNDRDSVNRSSLFTASVMPGKRVSSMRISRMRE